MARLFVPGFGARPGFYRAALGEAWLVHEPPPFRSGAGFAEHVAALRTQVASLDAPVTLAGHSLGAAVSVAAAAEMPGLVARLLLIAPAGLPLTKPVRESLGELRTQVREGAYPSLELAWAVAGALRAPRSAWRLGQAVRALDLRTELAAVRAAGIRCEVVGCAGDTLTPVEHCRRVARLAGAEFREIAAQGGHMWPVIDPRAFGALSF